MKDIEQDEYKYQGVFKADSFKEKAVKDAFSK